MTKKDITKFHKHLTLAIILLIITATVVGVIFVVSIGFTDAQEVTHTNEYYELRGNSTNYQEALFKELTNLIEHETRDDLEISKLLVQNFVADYYTWNNKLGTYDVGGKTFVFATEFTNFNGTNRRYLYEPMMNFLASGLELTDLQEVGEVIITANASSYPFDYKGKPYPSFYIEATWTYVENEKLDTSIFPSWGAFTVIKTEEGRYEIARFY